MNLAIELHHELIRALLRKHYGYESATEGDSFIAAFHNPEDAVCFSCALQRDMLDLPWPDELLEHASGAAVWATQAAVARGMTVTKSQLQLQVQNHEGSIPSLQAPQAGKPRGKPVPGFALLRHLLQRRSRSPTQSQPQGSTPLIHSLSHKHFGCISHVDVATTFDAERSTLNSPAVGTASHLIVSPGTSPRVEGTSPRAETNGLTTSGSTPQHVGLGAWAAVRESATAGWLAHDIAVAGPSMSCSVHQFYCEHYSVVEAVATPSHPGGGAQGSSHSHGTRSMHGANRRGRILFRGLRVRVGIHCGIHSPADVVDNKISGRVEYSGAPMALAKAVGDVGHGGMVLLSGDALAALPPPALPKLGLILNLGDVRFKKDAELPPTTVYQVVPPELEGRIALCPNTLRGTEMLAVGVLSAPLGTVAVSFVKLVGASTLLAWNREQGMEALEVFQKHAVTSLAKQSSGYLVELAGGLALAAFGQPAHALQFGVALIAGLQHADWNEELLAHELCEEVRVAQRPVAESSEAAGGGTHRQDTSIINLRTSLADITLDATGLTNNPATSPMLAMVAAGSGLSLPPPVPSVLYAAASLPRSIMSSMQNPDLPGLHHGHSAGLLFRGPRLKLGVDVGQVHAAISPATGRMGYRGRVMNRAARIAEKAGSGQVWCSTAVWEAAGGDYALAELGIEGSPLGQLPFKGLMEPIDVVHARAVYRLQPMPCVPATQTAATRAASVSHAHALGPPDSNSHSSSLRLIPRPAVLRAESWRASRVHEWSQACGCAPRAASSDHYAVSAPPGSGMSVAAQMEHPAGQTGARTDATPHMVRPMTVLELLPAHPRPSGPHARGMATPFMGAPASATGTAKPSSACNAAPSASTAVLPNSASGAGHVTPGVRTPVPMYHSMPEPGVPGNSLLQRVVSTITGSRLQPIPPRASDVPDGMLGGALWAADGEAGVEAGSQQSTVATFQGMQI